VPTPISTSSEAVTYASFTKSGTPLNLRPEDPEASEDPEDAGALAHPANDSSRTSAAPKTKDFFIFFSFAAFAALKI
jgi:hypothetical protein